MERTFKRLKLWKITLTFRAGLNEFCVMMRPVDHEVRERKVCLWVRNIPPPPWDQAYLISSGWGCFDRLWGSTAMLKEAYHWVRVWEFTNSPPLVCSSGCDLLDSCSGLQIPPSLPRAIDSSSATLSPSDLLFHEVSLVTVFSHNREVISESWLSFACQQRW